MTESVQYAKTAADLVGIPAETLLLGQVHYHALVVADATSADRVGQVGMLLNATATLSEIVTSPYKRGDDGGDAIEPLVPVEPPSEAEKPPDIAPEGFDGRGFLSELLTRARSRFGAE